MWLSSNFPSQREKKEEKEKYERKKGCRGFIRAFVCYMGQTFSKLFSPGYKHGEDNLKLNFLNLIFPVKVSLGKEKKLG